MASLTRFSNTVSALASFVFGAASRQSDHQRLVQYIVALNQRNSPEDIIAEASCCLKDILNFRLFAFVFNASSGIDVWLDPKMYKKSLESVVINDFQISDKAEINYLNHTFEDQDTEKTFSMNNLVSYDLQEEAYQAKIYMLPGHRMLGHHDEIVNVILKSTAIAIARQKNIARLTNAASMDPLTGCYNRREFDVQINRHSASAIRHNSALSLFIFDIDHFKRVNDSYGHQAGDQVLQQVVSVVQANIRTGDVLARYGGEEFVVILPETSLTEAVELADRLRKRISRELIKTRSGVIAVTASFGVAELSGSSALSRLVQDADEMLYRAKETGRNRVMPAPKAIFPRLLKPCPDSPTAGNHMTLRLGS